MTERTDFRLRASRLSTGRKRLLRRRLQNLAGAGLPQSSGGRLIAVIVAGGCDFDSSGLRDHCKDKLPQYMVPQLFSEIDEMPRTAAGKIDRQALQERSWSAEHGDSGASAGPRTDVQQKLAEIWADVLGFDEINIDDNFFEVGGDSLLTIRILSRAAKAGLHIAPAAFFANPTIAEQARLVDEAPAMQAETGPVSGPLLLTPIQHWFFQHIKTDPQQWNQSFLFELTKPVAPAHLRRALDEILQHHDGLRTSFEHSNGSWSARIAGTVADLPLRTVDVGEFDEAGREASIRTLAAELNAEFQLGAAPLLRAAHFVTGTGSGDHLLIVTHHLIIDATSWRILLSDLETLLVQLTQGRHTDLPHRTTSLQDWAMRLDDFANDSAVEVDRTYWADAASGSALPIPVDYDQRTATNREAGSITAPFLLGKIATDRIVKCAQNELHASMNAVLLSALARAVAEWTGETTVTLDVEGHGREPLFDDVNLSRTIGWFTTVYPLVLRAPDSAVWNNPNAALRLVKESVQAIPKNGIGFGLLTELNRNAANKRELEQCAGGQILFNYLGKVDRGAGNKNLLRLADPNCGQSRSERCERAYLIEVNIGIAGGRLRADCSYNSSIHKADTVHRLGQSFIAALEELPDSVAKAESSAVVAADFPLAGLDQEEFISLSAQLDELDDD